MSSCFQTQLHRLGSYRHPHVAPILNFKENEIVHCRVIFHYVLKCTLLDGGEISVSYHIAICVVVEQRDFDGYDGKAKRMQKKREFIFLFRYQNIVLPIYKRNYNYMHLYLYVLELFTK